ncbi:60Kd inner membrane protein-domain-containing protein [Chaetomium tenue]|uniref:60Kd inner membrane protein-domain-containing protein n=1 Tax=Chaetomium tenue TaxID=1854479 RepID=A0ACB7PI35_9PEZI|nr:60Kd inner membrane protein-domain-containing protein [Chaetomium globosum]
MASEEPPNPMAESGVTIPSDSEQYSRHGDQSISPPSFSSPAVILYQPPTIWSIIRGAAINLFLPFVNGMMLGFGELFAHEAAFRLGWSNTRRGNGKNRTKRGAEVDRSLCPYICQRNSAREPPPAKPRTGACKSMTLHGASTARRIGGPLAFTLASQRPTFANQQSRNASTQPTIPPTSASDASSLADITGTPVNLTGSDLLNIPEQIGFLKTLGLEFGWGPTSLMQTVLESVYVYTSLPWWASIAVVAVGLRLALLKPALDASENTVKYQRLLKNPEYAAAMEDMKSLMITGNHMAGAQARAKVSLMNKEAGYSLWKNFTPMLQLPLGYGMFRLIKGMSALPVPSFETGGILWFTDLTVADPLFIMPIITGLVVMVGMRIPLPYMAPQQQQTMKTVALVVMPLSTAVSLFFPSGLALYFLLSSLLHTSQTYMMHQHWFRRMIGLPPLNHPAGAGGMTWQAPRIVDMTAPRVTPIRPSAPPASESVYASLQSSIASAREKLNQRSDNDAAKRAQKAAQQYEEKRALEEKEKIIGRLQKRKGRQH